MTRGILSVHVVEGKNLRDLDDVGQGDPYCEVWIDSPKHKSHTDARNGTTTPVWDKMFHYNVNGQPELHIRIMDDDVFTDEVVGCATIPLDYVYKHNYKDFWVDLPDHRGRNNGKIHLVLEFNPKH
ncbi:hypothetical protein Glove_535g39 [Diversispora epigaea]|uniref:C2 domain-containing protein n=1 Tax=Diversispora epigaea TaxID=1348612 RepID=A0A397GLW6_9GLOM|nr:hypothetical protein Glove_535g39 [Diversispora epigaea]